MTPNELSRRVVNRLAGTGESSPADRAELDAAHVQATLVSSGGVVICDDVSESAVADLRPMLQRQYGLLPTASLIFLPTVEAEP